MLVWNKETNLPDNVDEDSITADKHEALVGQQITMADPNGSIHTIPGSSFQKAIDLGWVIATPKEGEFGRTYENAITTSKSMEDKAQHDAEVAAKVQQEELLAGGAAGYSKERFLNQALLGAPDIIKEKGIPSLGIAPQTDIEKEVEQKHAELHPVAGALGSIGGFGSAVFGAPGKIVGGIGRGVEEAAINKLGQSAIAGIAAKAAATAIEGAAFAAPGAATNIAAGDYGAAKESIGWGFGTGLVLGTALGAGGKLLGAAKGAVPDLRDSLLIQQAGLDENVLNQAAKGSPAKAIEQKQNIMEFIKTQPDLTKFDIDELIKQGPNAKIPTMEETGGALSKENLQKIGKVIGKDVGELGGGDGSLDARINTHNNDILSGNSISTDKAPIELPKVQDILSSINKDIRNDIPILQNDILGLRASKDLATLEHAIISAGDKKTGELTLEQLQNLKTQLYGFLKDKEDPNHIKDIRDYVFGKVRNIQQNTVKEVYNSLEDVEGLTKWNTANRMYSTYKLLDEFGPDVYRQPSSGAKAAGGALGFGTGRAVMTAVGAAGGAAMGGLPGAAIGGGMGFISGGLGRAVFGKAFAKAIESKGIPLAIRTLKTISKDSTIPNNLAGNGIAQLGINAIGDAVTKAVTLLGAEKGQTKGYIAKDPIKVALGDDANGLSKKQQYERIVSKITAAHTNPTNVINNVGALTSVFAHDPQLASAIANQQYHTLQYLYDQLPKNPLPPQPYSAREWEPTPQQKTKFSQQLAIVEDPMVAIEKLANGTLQPHEIQTFKDVYPDTYGKMVNAIIAAGFDEKGPKLTYAQKVKVSAFVGQPLDKSLEQKNIAAVQQSYTPPQPPAQPPGTTRSNKMHGKGPQLETTAQRLEKGLTRNA